MKTFHGTRHQGSVSVEVRDADEVRTLLPGQSQKVWNHSPSGFEWGYGGSGPAQLALALLLDVYDDPEFVLRYYQQFKRAWIAKLPKTGWTITEVDVRGFVNAMVKKDAEMEKAGRP